GTTPPGTTPQQSPEEQDFENYLFNQSFGPQLINGVPQYDPMGKPAKARLKPGEFLMNLDQQAPGFVRKNLPAIMKFIASQRGWTQEGVNNWFQTSIGPRFLSRAPIDEQGRSALWNLLQEQGRMHRVPWMRYALDLQ